MTQSGSHTYTAESLEADIDDGAPTNPDGTINLIHFAAWLMKEDALENGD